MLRLCLTLLFLFSSAGAQEYPVAKEEYPVKDPVAPKYHCKVYDNPIGPFRYGPKKLDFNFPCEVSLIYTKFTDAKRFPYLRFYNKYNKQLPKDNTVTWRGNKYGPEMQYYDGSYHVPQQGVVPPFSKMRIKFRDSHAKLLKFKVCGYCPLPEYPVKEERPVKEKYPVKEEHPVKEKYPVEEEYPVKEEYPVVPKYQCKSYENPIGPFRYAPKNLDFNFPCEVSLISTKFTDAKRFPYLRFYDNYNKQLPKDSPVTWRGNKHGPEIKYFDGSYEVPQQGVVPPFSKMRIKFRDSHAKLLEFKVCGYCRLPDKF